MNLCRFWKHNNASYFANDSFMIISKYMDLYFKENVRRWYAFCMVFMWDGFFSPRVSECRPSHVATRVGFGDEWWEIHLTWKTIQNAVSCILCTLKHFNQAKYNVQSCRSWKPCEMDLSHNCSLHGGKSEVCEKLLSDVNTKKNSGHICSHLMYQTCVTLCVFHE